MCACARASPVCVCENMHNYTNERRGAEKKKRQNSINLPSEVQGASRMKPGHGIRTKLQSCEVKKTKKAAGVVKINPPIRANSGHLQYCWQIQ